MVRNTNIEILRILSMLLIVMHHYSVHGGFVLDQNIISFNNFLVQFLHAGGKLGVDIFVLITGFFLIESSFKAKKLFKLLLVVFTYSISIYLIFTAFGLIDFNIKKAIKSFFPIIFGQYWFATSYMLLYIFSPYINSLIKAIDKKKHFNLVIILLLFWSVFPTITSSINLNFSSIGWFCTLYIIASYIRLYPNNYFDNCKINFLTALITYSFILLSIVLFDVLGVKIDSFSSKALHFTGMNQIPILICAVSLFLGFKNCKIPNNKIINIISSSMFGVYLIHDNYLVRPFLWLDLFNNQSFYHSPYLLLHAIVTIFSVFFVCILLDQIRYNIIEKPLFALAETTIDSIIYKLEYLKRVNYVLVNRVFRRIR